MERRIVEAARYCFRTQGVERTRMDDVARVVGIARPNLYRYVSNKDALVALVVIAETKKTDEMRRRLLPIEGPVGPLIVESLALGVELAREDDVLLALSTGSRPASASLIGPHGKDLPRASYWFPIFDHGRERGELRDDLTNDEIRRWIGLMTMLFIQRDDMFPDTETIRHHAQR
ncbi:MAG: helix-turn-helix domain-containing protein, partial [Ilumatobacteraceae bacterium]